MLQRIRTLAVQSANGTLGDDDREAIQKESDSLTAEITRIATQTTYGGKTILNGYDADDSIYSGEKDGPEDPDTTGKILGSLATLTLHVGANTGNVISMEVYNFDFIKLVSAANATAAIAKDASGVATFKVGNQTDANTAINHIDSIISIVDQQRADLGAIQNRLESSIRNQSNVSANSADARSRIRDADFAEESANLSQQSIIQQAATSMLMQANTRPQLALSMLG